MFSLHSIVRGAWLLLCAVWIAAALRNKPKAYAERTETRIGHLLTIAIAFTLLFSVPVRVGILAMPVIPHSVVIDVLAAVLTIGGVFLAVWARFYLGGNWSAIVAIKQGHTLVRSGPYAFVRHPIYAGILIAMLGSALAFAELGCLLALPIAFAAFLAKARMEDEFLAARFGAEYRAYREHVRLLIPFVL